MRYFMKHHVPDLNKGKQGRTKENQGTSACSILLSCARSIAGHSEWDCLNACDESALIVLTSWQNFAIKCLQFTRFRQSKYLRNIFCSCKVEQSPCSMSDFLRTISIILQSFCKTIPWYSVNIHASLHLSPKTIVLLHASARLQIKCTTMWGHRLEVATKQNEFKEHYADA